MIKARSAACLVLFMTIGIRSITAWSTQLASRSFPRRLASGRPSRLCSTNSQETVQLIVPTEADMQDMGALLARLVLDDTHQARGSILCLDGDLGAGKTAFSRGFVRAALEDPQQRVTSPTYLLSNAYRLDDTLEIYHMDLYRLSGQPQDLEPLNLPHVFESHICLIEWPSRLGQLLPENRLDVLLRIENDNEDHDEDKPRLMSLEPHGRVWRDRIQELVQEGYIDDLLVGNT